MKLWSVGNIMFETRPNVLLELQVAAWCQALGSGLNTCFSGGVLVEAASASSSFHGYVDCFLTAASTFCPSALFAPDTHVSPVSY